MTNPKRIILIIIIITLLAAIFVFSNQNGQGSKSLSKDIAIKIAGFIYGTDNASKDELDNIHGIVRKCAHLTLYFILGVLIFGFANTYSISTNKKVIISQCLGIFYAVFDEIHQLFIDGRSAKVTDVLIDSIGIAVGIMVVLIIKKIKLHYIID